MSREYQFSFGYLALKMLGKTLYSNPFAALSELIANGFDANANKVWVYIDIRSKKQSEIIVIDNGRGMSDNDVKEKYLQVGKKNRENDNFTMMGRKGIGKLAAFYLSNHYYVVTKTFFENNIYEIDFTKHENGAVDIEDNNYINKINEMFFVYKEIFDNNFTGTAIVMKNVNFTGYGDRSFEVLSANLAELFSFKNIDRKVYLKIVKNNEDLNNDFEEVRKKIAFKNMAKIYYNLPDIEFLDVLSLNGEIIKNTENKVDEIPTKIIVERYTQSAREAVVGEKSIKLNPTGWIGIHQTINRKLANLNDEENFITSSFYHFNKIRVYIRGKLAMDNILPLVHNTQYYSNYIEGEIHCDELDDNNLPDITSSSRQDLDKNDDRFIALIEYVKAIVNNLVNFKDKQSKNDNEKHKAKQANAVKLLGDDIEESLNKKRGKKITKNDIVQIKRSVVNSFEQVNDQVKTDYVIFLSHRRVDKYVSDFIFNFLTETYGYDKKYIFYSSQDGGVDQRLKTLEKQIYDTLTNNNTYVVFCIASEKFKESEFCMFEGGAAWAVKQKEYIGLIYNDYDKDVPAYLKNMPNINIDCSNPILTRNLYVSIVKMLNSMIQYLNRNFADEINKKELLEESLPNDFQLSQEGKNIEDYFNKDVAAYWDFYIVRKGV